MSRRGPRCVFLDRLPGTLTVGEFVHVKEVIGPDRQKNKVYRILRFSADERTFLGEYYEQPRFAGSSLTEHDFDTDGYDGHRELPEIVLTPEASWLPLSRVQSEIVFAFHWKAIEAVDATPVDMDGAYVYGRRIRKYEKRGWVSIPLKETA